MKHLRSYRKGIATGLIGLVVVISGSVAAPRPVHALFGVGDVVIDPTNLVQNTLSAINEAAKYTLDYVLNGLAWEVANVAVDSMVKSTVNWINSGFNGSPAFVTDLNRNLQGVGDAVADRFFDELSMQDIAKTPDQDRVLDAVRLGYYLRTSPESFYTRYPYTLNQVSPNDNAFLQGDFSQGGFNAWFATVMNPQNNPYGAQMLADQALQGAIQNATGNRLEELSWNRGFLSWRGECLSGSGMVDLSGKEECDDYEIRTPGSVIMESLNRTSFAGLDRLINADQINEVVGALLNQLVGQVLGTNGVRGASSPSAGGGSSFLDRATDPSQGGSGAAIANNFSRTLDDQLARIREYSQNWERIRGVAQAAQNKCGPNTGNPATPANVLERAGTAIAKASDATAILESMKATLTQARASGGNQTQILFELSQEYNDLVSSSMLMSGAELTEAQLESLDTRDEEPGSLYSQMVRITEERSCSTVDT